MALSLDEPTFARATQSLPPSRNNAVVEYLLGYQPLNTYKYQYEACLTSGFPDTEQQYAGLKIVCDTEFYFGGDDSAFLKVNMLGYPKSSIFITVSLKRRLQTADRG